MPTAEAVARAVVAAARITDEDPLTVADGLGLRFRFAAMKALLTFYPEAGPLRIGRMVGVERNPMGRLQQAERSSWWRPQGKPAYEAAFEALEAL